LNDSRLTHAAFIAETPIDEPGDDRKNVAMLKSLVRKTELNGRRRSRPSSL
jgi:deoxyribonuclease IV